MAVDPVLTNNNNNENNKNNNNNNNFTLRALTENLSLMAVDLILNTNLQAQIHPFLVHRQHHPKYRSKSLDLIFVEVTNRLLGVSVNGQVSRGSFPTAPDKVRQNRALYALFGNKTPNSSANVQHKPVNFEYFTYTYL